MGGMCKRNLTNLNEIWIGLVYLHTILFLFLGATSGCAKGLLQRYLGDCMVPGIDLASATCKANALTFVLPFWPQDFFLLNLKN